MRRGPVASTSLRSVGYDGMRHVLEVEFRNGGIYQYRGVPEGVLRRLLDAGSLGAHFNRFIRDRYPTVRVR